MIYEFFIECHRNAVSSWSSGTGFGTEVALLVLNSFFCSIVHSKIEFFGCF
jgi:hypothetical protein